ncbi:MAG: AI-2E family transporter, partial [Balneolaceae bacterium]|nr:AI-2E family transporter [Balneolaceae bacterium]
MSNLTLEKIVRFTLGLAGTAVVILLLYNYSILVGYAIIAMILSYILDPFVNRMQAAGMNRMLAIILTLSTVVLVLFWISTSIIPLIANQMVELASQLNIQNIESIAERVEARLMQNFTFLPEGFLRDNISNVMEGLLDVGNLPTALSNIIGIFTNL